VRERIGLEVFGPVARPCVELTGVDYRRWPNSVRNTAFTQSVVFRNQPVPFVGMVAVELFLLDQARRTGGRPAAPLTAATRLLCPVWTPLYPRSAGRCGSIQLRPVIISLKSTHLEARFTHSPPSV
jgi:hypothetical protein